MIDLALWMPQCDNSVGVTHEYKKIIKTIETSIQSIQELWNV